MSEKEPARKASPAGRCEHGLPFVLRDPERLCALEYLNRFVAPRRVERVSRRGTQLYLHFETGERLECCCESCGESHGDDPGFTDDIKDVALGRRALRFRLEDASGQLVVWFARGDHLHLHKNALKRFRPRRARSVRLRHSDPPPSPPPAE